ncbi:unnamed protein product [Lupinus luteus]|uniref:Uncharacterized protein n=1 Tax=Lupinus luteus TaxID=3873 RepID=A0AAV1WNF4_LUPLU
MNSLGSGPPIVGRNGTFSGSVPQPGFRSGTFAPGPNHAYSRQNSGVRASGSQGVEGVRALRESGR